MSIEALRRDPVMAEQIERFGLLELKATDDLFGRLVTSIINQQLSVAAARTIRERVQQRVDFTPEALLAVDEQLLRDAGLSKQKVAYVRSASEAYQRDDLSRAKFDEMSNEEVIAELTKIHGVGVWTAKMFLIFSLARPDVFAVEDLGIRRGMTVLYGLEDRPEMVKLAEQWSPARSLACLYLWRASEG